MNKKNIEGWIGRGFDEFREFRQDNYRGYYGFWRSVVLSAMLPFMLVFLIVVGIPWGLWGEVGGGTGINGEDGLPEAISAVIVFTLLVLWTPVVGVPVNLWLDLVGAVKFAKRKMFKEKNDST